MASAGFLIYSGVMPLLKTIITIIFGFILEKKNLFPPAAVRGASQVSMNVALPCLIFSSMVPAFTPSNISAIGPLALTSIIYVAIGFAFGYIIREVFYVPRNFWQGIVIATALSNWGNLPTAVVQSVTAQAPFDPATDTALGVSFVSIFTLVLQLAYWVFGAAASLRWDFLPDVPQGEAAMVRIPWSQKPIGSRVYRLLGKSIISNTKSEKESDKDKAEEDGRSQRFIAHSVRALEMGPIPGTSTPPETNPDADPDIALARRVSRFSAPSLQSRRRRSDISQDPSEKEEDGDDHQSQYSLALSDTQTQTYRTFWEKHVPDHIRASLAPITPFLRPLSALFTPITLSLIIAIPCAVVPDLKALFTDATSSGGPHWTGPDGEAPLAFILDTAEFVGAISIPLSLILLGASFSNMKIPRPISRLPIGAMLAVTAAKMIILPVIGVFIVQAMVGGGLIPKENLAERFVAMFLSGTPTAVNQLIVANIYAPEGGADLLTAFLLVQYVFMFISSAALTAVSLLLL